MYNISILVPGIRTYNWLKLYNSLSTATLATWEIIFIGPYGLPPELHNKDNIQYINDWGSPIRCQQIGLLNARGQRICWMADDGCFLPKSLDISLGLLQGLDPLQNVVMHKYLESDTPSPDMQTSQYYLLDYHDGLRISGLPKNYYTLMSGMVHKDLLLDIGGWDCQFEVCPMSYTDLAIRLQNKGVKFIIQEEVAFTCGHMPGITGDHAPIHYAQAEHDTPLYRYIYSQPNPLYRIAIDINNWQNSSPKWIRRFPN